MPLISENRWIITVVNQSTKSGFIGGGCINFYRGLRKKSAYRMAGCQKLMGSFLKISVPVSERFYRT